MYKVAVKVAQSEIDGKGVFAAQDIDMNAVVWVFAEGHDIAITVEEHNALPQETKDKIGKIGYLSPWTNLWIFPPDDDPAHFTNHSNKNNLSVMYDPAVSSEPYFVANKDITVGEELTNNYHEFDAITQATKPKWAEPTNV